MFNESSIYFRRSRKNGNTEYLLDISLEITGGELIRLSDYNIKYCNSCWVCQKTGICPVKDDMNEKLIPMILESDGIVLGTPVYFNNVSAQLKTFIDRTWCIKGGLRNKIGGAVVVGRKYGAESAITAINAFFLKHEMIVANRGISGIGYAKGDIESDVEAVEAAKRLGYRILELLNV
ncbi:flavodoxin family protein [Thermoanaerobacterium thermosaccharolyticum]|jgi:NADPH-dependent FMN reductase.|uniref:flavodoxin family protein n=1 Tax=Thermoanaerobacterium thermosaccharolyticum TaxID=1517 RepID=UPI0027A1D642|nr:flavodoxin family protein [Thermoanaerobacterium thermosaccharolyticum]